MKMSTHIRWEGALVDLSRGVNEHESVEMRSSMCRIPISPVLDESGYSSRNFCHRLDLTRSNLFLFPFPTRVFERRLLSLPVLLVALTTQ